MPALQGNITSNLFQFFERVVGNFAAANTSYFHASNILNVSSIASVVVNLLEWLFSHNRTNFSKAQRFRTRFDSYVKNFAAIESVW